MKEKYSYSNLKLPNCPSCIKCSQGHFTKQPLGAIKRFVYENKAFCRLRESSIAIWLFLSSYDKISL